MGDFQEKGNHEPIGARLPAYLTPPLRNFFTGVLRGDLQPLAEEEIETGIHSHFNEPPLTPFTENERFSLIRDMREQYTGTLTYFKWLGLAEKVFYVPPELVALAQRYLPNIHEGILAGNQLNIVTERIGLKPITRTELEILLTTPKQYPDLYLNINGIGIHPYYSRHLYKKESIISSSYGYSADEIRNLLREIRQTQGKPANNMLCGLDIGGSVGLAAHEAEVLDSNLFMTNLTIHPDICVWPLQGGHVLQPAEYMPTSFGDRFDIIFSNFAFTYMRYPDLALKNAIKALTKGGILSIIFSTERSPLRAENREDELMNRIHTLFETIRVMQETGRIKIRTFQNPSDNAYQKWLSGNKDPYGWLQLQRL